MKKQANEKLLKFLAETKDGKYAVMEESSLEYTRIEVETDMSSEYSDYLYSVR